MGWRGMGDFYEYMFKIKPAFSKEQIKRGWKDVKIAFSDKWSYAIFALTWLFLMSPAIVGGILGIIFKVKWGYGLMTGWIAFTAGPIPFPVIAMCVGNIFLVKKIKKSLQNKKRKI